MLVKKGSVKNIYETDDQLWFEYSDRYSIYDWGEMPDEIHNKGFALLLMAEFFFEYFEKHNIPTHFRKRENNRLFVTKYHVPNIWIDEGYNYDYYQKLPSDCLVPLECIFRFGVPKGSSLLKRINDEKYRKEIGLTDIPKEGDIFDKPIIEFSTKLESTDRYLSYSEAKEISGMSDSEFQKFQSIVKHSALTLKKIMTELSVTLWDGKFEYAFDNERNFVMIDSIGPDELRLTINEVQLSKQNLRNFYQGTNWQAAVSEAKKIAEKENKTNWKNICVERLHSSPPSLKEEQRIYASSLYTSLTNHLFTKANREIPFKDAKSLAEVISYFRGL